MRECERRPVVALLCLLAVPSGVTALVAQDSRCAGSGQGFFFSPAQDAIRFSGGEIRGAKDPNSKPVLPLLADCDNDNRADAIISWSENPGAPAEIVFNNAACGSRLPVEIEIRARQGSNTVWTAFRDNGTQADQETVADASFTERTIALTAASGAIQRVTILGSQLCIEDICWRCPVDCAPIGLAALLHRRRGTGAELTWYAEAIDFETGFVERDAVGTVPTAANDVTFSVTGGGPGFIGGVGPPRNAFNPADTPAGGVPGRFFLSDEKDGPGSSRDYFIQFAKPVLNLALDVYDYRLDDPASAGGVATLTAYADAARTIAVGSYFFAVPTPRPTDGNAETLAISAPSAPIAAAVLRFSEPDGGTAIDNVRFTTAGAAGCCSQFRLLRDGAQIGSVASNALAFELRDCLPGEYCVECVAPDGKSGARTCWSVLATDCGARENCAAADDLEAGPNVEVEQVDFGGVRIVKDAAGSAKLSVKDCDGDGDLEVELKRAPNSSRSSAFVDLTAACGRPGVLPARVSLRFGRPSVLPTARALRNGALVDAGASAWPESALTLEHGGGMDRIEISVPSLLCLEEICWSCEPGLRTEITIPDRALVAGGPPVRSGVFLDSLEPAGAIRLALRMEPPNVVEIADIAPGRGVPRDAIKSFSSRLEDPQASPNAGSAAAELILEPGAPLGPGENREVFEIFLRAREGADSGNLAKLCAAAGQSQSPEGSSISVLRGNAIVNVPLPGICASLIITEDVSPPILDCPAALAVEGTSDGAIVDYDVSASDDSGEVAVACDPPVGSRFPVGTTRVACSATDGAGNVASCSFEITVRARSFLRADVNEDGSADVSDAVAVFSYLFQGGARPGCLSAADANDDGAIDISDGAQTLNHLFLQGSPPPEPFPGCGADPTPDSLPCPSHRACPTEPLPEAGSLLDRLLLRIPMGPPQGPQPEPPTIVELRRGVKLPREHLAVELEPDGQITRARLRYWHGRIELRDPAALGQPFSVTRFEGPNKVTDTWYRLPGGRASRPLFGPRGGRAGVLSLGTDGSLIALDVDRDGAADLVDIVSPCDIVAGEGGGFSEILLVATGAGSGFVEAALRAVDPRARSIGGSAGFDLVGGLARALGARASVPGPHDGGIDGTPLFESLLIRLTAMPVDDRMAAMPRYFDALPDIPHTIPLPAEDGPVSGLFDRPVIEGFATSLGSCTTTHDPERPLLSYRVVPGPSGAVITRVKITAVNLDDGLQTILDISAPPGAPWPVSEASAIPDPRGDGGRTEAYVIAAWDTHGRAVSRRMPFQYATVPGFEIGGEVEEIYFEGRFEYRVDVIAAEDVREVCVRPDLPGYGCSIPAVFGESRGSLHFCSPIQLSASVRRILYEAHAATACDVATIERTAEIVWPVRPPAVCGQPDFIPSLAHREETHQEAVYIAVVNDGPIPGGTEVLVTADSGVSFRFEVPVLASASTPGMDPGALLVAQRVELTIRGRMATRFAAMVDPDDAVAEMEEGNNVLNCFWDGTRWVSEP